MLSLSPRCEDAAERPPAEQEAGPRPDAASAGTLTLDPPAARTARYKPLCSLTHLVSGVLLQWPKLRSFPIQTIFHSLKRLFTQTVKHINVYSGPTTFQALLGSEGK